VLEEYGYAVLTASNAASALVMLQSNDGIDLLFTDLVTPVRWHRIGAPGR
jgi:CheY-like chemotaxis protein